MTKTTRSSVESVSRPRPRPRTRSPRDRGVRSRRSDGLPSLRPASRYRSRRRSLGFRARSRRGSTSRSRRCVSIIDRAYPGDVRHRTGTCDPPRSTPGRTRATSRTGRRSVRRRRRTVAERGATGGFGDTDSDALQEGAAGTVVHTRQLLDLIKKFATCCADDRTAQSSPVAGVGRYDRLIDFQRPVENR